MLGLCAAVTSARSWGMIGLSPRSQRGSWGRACCRSPAPQPRLRLRSGGRSVLVLRRRRSGSGKRPGRLLSLQPPPSSPPLPGSSTSWVWVNAGGAAELCCLLLLLQTPGALHRVRSALWPGRMHSGAGRVSDDGGRHFPASWYNCKQRTCQIL